MKRPAIRSLLAVGILCLFLSTDSAFATLLDLVPVEAQFVMQLNMPKVVGMDVTQKLLDQFGAGTAESQKAMQEFIQKTGLDPKKNLKTVVVFLTALTDSESGHPIPGLLFHGDFDTGRIIEMVKADPEMAAQVSLEKVGGFDALKGKKVDTGLSVFLDKNTILLGTPAIVDTVIKVKAGKGKGVMTHAPFAKVVKQASPEVALWGGVVVSPQWTKEAQADPVNANFAAVKAVLFTLAYDKNFSFELAGEVEKKEQTAQVKDALKNTIDAMAAWSQDVPAISQAFKAAKIDGGDTTAKLTLAMDKAAFEDMIKKVQAQAAPTAAPKK